MRKLVCGLATLLAVGCGGTLQDPMDTSADIQPDGKGVGTLESFAKPDGQGKPAGGNGISYHGGPVMTGTVNAYYIWYGNWSGNSATTILTDFIQNIGGSPYYNI